MKQTPNKIQPNETHCLNCGTELNGPFCAQCGQKANVHKDTFWHMLVHFIGDYFHYNSKFSTTAKTLFTKPGLITLDYIQGKRARYLNPIQLYIFISTVFLILLVSIQDPPPTKINRSNKSAKQAQPNDSTLQQILTDADIKPQQSGTETETTDESGFRFHLEGPTATSIEEYDSLQTALPASKRDHLIIRPFFRKLIQISNMYETDEEINHAIITTVLRNTPKALFVLLPFFALLLYALFRRQQTYYVDHLILSIHFHCFLYVIIGLLIILGMFVKNESLLSMLTISAFIGAGSYFLLSLRRVYKQSWGVLLTKQVVLSGIYIVSLIIALALLFIVSILAI